jgi:hypothetical protein
MCRLRFIVPSQQLFCNKRPPPLQRLPVRARRRYIGRSQRHRNEKQPLRHRCIVRLPRLRNRRTHPPRLLSVRVRPPFIAPSRASSSQQSHPLDNRALQVAALLQTPTRKRHNSNRRRRGRLPNATPCLFKRANREARSYRLRWCNAVASSLLRTTATPGQ